MQSFVTNIQVKWNNKFNDFSQCEALYLFNFVFDKFSFAFRFLYYNVNVNSTKTFVSNFIKEQRIINVFNKLLWNSEYVVPYKLFL